MYLLIVHGRFQTKASKSVVQQISNTVFLSATVLTLLWLAVLEQLQSPSPLTERPQIPTKKSVVKMTDSSLIPAVVRSFSDVFPELPITSIVPLV